MAELNHNSPTVDAENLTSFLVSVHYHGQKDHLQDVATPRRLSYIGFGL